ncbi:MAG TPA: extracellular solute-binding protein [Microvirga sp.]|jgi:multiple sugar transport system substrate-binding protein|nr:extracellular solute-binding protein [Microvirga sp.]
MGLRSKLFRAGAALAVMAGVSLGTMTSAFAQKVQIEYWQYFFEGRVKAIDALIKTFEAQNPDIKVVHTHFPYEQYRTKVAAAVPAGEGPDVVQLFYGWLDEYRKAGLLQPLSKEAFDPAQIEKDFFPMVQAMKAEGQYWAMPTAVRSLALFWNKRLFKEAGLDPEKPPQTNEELLAMAQKLTKRDATGNLLVAGMTISPEGQDHHWWREVLVRQFGGKPYTDDNKKVTYNDEAGVKALTWYTDLMTKHKIGEIGFMDEGQAAFRAARAAMTVDGSFRLAAFDRQRGLDYGVAELPAHNGVKSNYASYWVNGVTSKAKAEKRAAAEKFLKHITTPEAMQVWLKEVGELPARKDAALTKENTEHPKYGAFIKGLDYAHATQFVAEADQRKIAMDMIDRVRLQNVSPADALKEAAEKEQKILDTYYGAK